MHVYVYNSIYEYYVTSHDFMKIRKTFDTKPLSWAGGKEKKLSSSLGVSLETSLNIE